LDSVPHFHEYYASFSCLSLNALNTRYTLYTVFWGNCKCVKTFAYAQSREKV
jgi:hypothetical protein